MERFFEDLIRKGISITFFLQTYIRIEHLLLKNIENKHPIPHIFGSKVNRDAGSEFGLGARNVVYSEMSRLLYIDVDDVLGDCGDYLCELEAISVEDDRDFILVEIQLREL